MNKTILSLTLFTILSSMFTTNRNLVNAETFTEIAYSNNAYQMCNVQDQSTNLYLGDSIYNYSLGSIRQKKSIKIKKPSSNKLTFYFNFYNSLKEYNYTTGEVRFTILNDDGSIFSSLAEQTGCLEDIEYALNRKGITQINEYEIFFEIDLTNSTNYITICGDEYENNNENFSIFFGEEKLLIKKFMLYDGSISDFHYKCPKFGLGGGSQSVYQNGSQLSYEINYDSRPSIDEIKKGITAYDYYDNSQITPTTVQDQYTNALLNNELGKFTVILNATDSSNNSTSITLNLNIVDTTSPILTGTTDIVIHYTDLPESKEIDLTQYVQGYDNHDGTIHIDNKYENYIPKMFVEEKINVSLIDESGNQGGGIITIKITDNISPIISGENEISVYQYELSSIEEVLNMYEITDDGSGISTTKISSNNYDLSKPGEYTLELTASDKMNNTSKKSIKLKVLDGVGPVFFVNVSSLTLSTESYQSAEQVINTLMDNGEIAQHNYKKCEYITKSYSTNYNKVGKYDTQIVCYSEDGTRDYYLVSIKVEEPKGSNFFTRFYSSMINFFENLWEFIKSIFEKVKSFFKR